MRNNGHGQGALVPGYLIVTAAHCISWAGDGRMALGDHYIEELSASGQKIRASPLALEPIADIAFLGDPDGQELYRWSNEFEKFAENTEPFAICTEEFPLFKPFPVSIFTHDRGWIAGEAQQCREYDATLWCSFPNAINGGTSGGPIVNERNELLGVMSTGGMEDGEACTIARPHLAGPQWLVRRMLGEK